MFEFVNERIINSKIDHFSGRNKFENLDEKTFRVYRFGTFDAGNVINRTVYKTPWSAPVKPVITITVPASIIPTTAGEVKNIRLMIDLRLSGSVNSEYSTYNSRIKAKPMVANLQIDNTYNVNDVALYLTQIFKDQDYLYDNLRVSVSNAGAVITITGETEFQWFYNVEIQELVNWNMAALGNYYPVEPVWKTVAKYDATAEDTRFGKEGFGTYWTMLKNVQIQTSLRTDVFAVDNDDTKLMPGANYNQYVLDYRCKRDITGMGAVGQELVSITKHVLWVNADIAADFEDVLRNSGLIVDDVTIKAADTTISINGDADLTLSLATDGEDGTNGKKVTIAFTPAENVLGYTARSVNPEAVEILDIEADGVTLLPKADSGSTQIVFEFEDNVNKVLNVTLSA